MLYWTLLRRKPTVELELRKRMVRYALRYGVSAAAAKFETTRKTMPKWRDRYLAEGARGLADRWRAPKHIPHKTPRRLIALRKR